MLKTLLNTTEVAEYFGFDETVVLNMLVEGKGPAWHNLSPYPGVENPRFLISDLDAWVNNRRVEVGIPLADHLESWAD